MENPSSKDKSPMRTYLLIGLAAVVLGVLLNWLVLSTSSDVKPDLKVGTWLPQPRPALDTRLIDQDGQTFGLKQLQGKWSFLFFGYTHCPDVCPATLYHFKTMHKLLEQNPDIQKQTQFILVSVDPKRDTPQQLKSYVKHFNPDFIGVTGEEKDLHIFSRHHGVIYQIQAPENKDEPDNYLVDHSAAVIMLNPKGQLQAIFSAPHNPQAMVKDFLTIHEHL